MIEAGVLPPAWTWRHQNGWLKSSASDFWESVSATSSAISAGRRGRHSCGLSPVLVRQLKSQSLDQQLRNILERARREDMFVPWAFVCADAAVSGTTSERRGYQMAKALIEADGSIECLYVDEMGRAARRS